MFSKKNGWAIAFKKKELWQTEKKIIELRQSEKKVIELWQSEKKIEFWVKTRTPPWISNGSPLNCLQGNMPKCQLVRV